MERPEAQQDTVPRKDGVGRVATLPRRTLASTHSPRTPGGDGSRRRRRRVGHKEEMGRGTDSEAVAADTGPPSRRWREELGASPPQPPPPREAAPTFLRAQNAAWAARDSETLSALPSPRALLSPTPPVRTPHPAATAACARPPPGSARVYLRPRSRRRLRRRRQPHCRSPGSRHAAAKFPNMDSVRFEVFRGR